MSSSITRTMKVKRIGKIASPQHSPPLPDVRGLEALKAHIAGIRSAYTENTLAYAEMIGEGDRVVYRYTWKARHTGQSETLPIPPTGKEADHTGRPRSRWCVPEE